MKHKTIAEHMRDTLIENGYKYVMWGDVGTLDDCASRCTHTDMNKVHPLYRHHRILNALDRSPLFEKGYVRLDIFQNNQSRLVRCFQLLELS